ncbi:putative chromatin regulator PHD family [Helianthus annuus]|nr:putative chromatin regulator PHD family [Helianthus annuus]
MMKVLEHNYPLKLIDLQQVKNEDVEESEEEDEEKDLVPQDEFSCICKRCDEVINEYYRYYYKCTNDLCDFSLHKFCAEVPTTLEHTSHPHRLTLYKYIDFEWRCLYCQRQHKVGEVGYLCSDCGWWKVNIDVNCVVEVEKRRIYHPSHPHPLVFPIPSPILCLCQACGKTHKGIFFLCTTCPYFTIHADCIFLPKSLLIQQTTNGIFRHTHPLTLSYSFPEAEQRAKYFPNCRVCNRSFDPYMENLWIYKCEKCIYYVHLDCATSASRREPFMSILSIGGGQSIKNFKDVDYPNLLRLPFPDQTYSLPKHLFFKAPGPTTYVTAEVSLQHFNHEHELILVDTESIGSTSNESIMCHNPMKKIELLCNACVRPITETPFYKCNASEDERCNFALHEWCTRLPTKLDNHPGHPQHTLFLMSNAPHGFFNIYDCGVCCLPCNGYAYGCVRCRFYIDVNCGLMPEKITHESHPNHLLSIVDKSLGNECLVCSNQVRYRLSFGCSTCNVQIHPACALLLPRTIRHPYDKHPMHLSYLPIENHKSEYFCEICEEGLNPHKGFYHCDMCSQSVHTDCAPLILQSETETHSNYHYSYISKVYSFSNVKFGSIHKTANHPHPLLLAPGIANDGKCSVCSSRLRYMIILRCLECPFAIHERCFKRLNKS